MSDGLSLAVMANFNYVDEMTKCIENLPLCEARDYTLVNARVSLAPTDQRWELALWSENLTDEEYEVEIFQQLSIGSYIINYGIPRTYGVTLRYNL